MAQSTNTSDLPKGHTVTNFLVCRGSYTARPAMRSGPGITRPPMVTPSPQRIPLIKKQVFSFEIGYLCELRYAITIIVYIFELFLFFAQFFSKYAPF